LALEKPCFLLQSGSILLVIMRATPPLDQRGNASGAFPGSPFFGEFSLTFCGFILVWGMPEVFGAKTADAAALRSGL
jgi:hypothetical protein